MNRARRRARRCVARRALLVAGAACAFASCINDVPLGDLGTGTSGVITVRAASCASAEVQAALDRAVSGDTVGIPAGECTWSTPVRLDASMRNVGLRGAGAGATIIHARTDAALAIDAGAGHAWEVSDVTFADGAGETIVSIGGEAAGWRFHDVAFLPTSGARTVSRLIRIDGHTTGVIYNVRASGNAATVFITAGGDSWRAWTRPLVLGSADAVVVEDCTVTWEDDCQGCSFVDTHGGAHVVIRHNHITNASIGAAGLDSSGDASGLALEVYANDFAFTPVANGWDRLGGGVLGGTGVFFDNTYTVAPSVWITSPAISLIVVRVDRALTNTPWLSCDGSQLRFCSNVDASWQVLSGDRPAMCHGDTDCPGGTTCVWKLCSQSRTTLCRVDTDCPGGETCSAYIDGTSAGGYPCFMQPGYGPAMAARPLYEWNNTMSGSTNVTDPNVNFVSETPVAVVGRDAFNDTPMPGYTPLAYPHPLRASSGP